MFFVLTVRQSNHCQIGSTVSSYFGGPKFKSLPRNWLCWFRFIMIFLHSLNRCWDRPWSLPSVLCPICYLINFPSFYTVWSALLMLLNKPYRNNMIIIYHSGTAEGCGLAVPSSSKIVSELLYVLRPHHSWLTQHLIQCFVIYALYALSWNNLWHTCTVKTTVYCLTSNRMSSNTWKDKPP
jgi:hypothetical protein